MMLFANLESRRHVRKLANNLGVDFEPYVSEEDLFVIKSLDQGSSVRDNTQADPSVVSSKNIFAPLTDLSLPVFDSSSQGIKFSGVGSYLDPENQFVFPILRAEPTTISSVSSGDQKKVSELSGE